jgi:putative peptidoglycan lipid II flippase
VHRRALAGIAGLSAAGTLLSRFTGLGRTVFQAATLGANGVSDAYNLANTTPNIIYDLIVGGILAGTLVPVFVQALADDEDSGWEAISAVCSAIAAVLVVVTVVFFAAAPFITHLLTGTVPKSGAIAERRLALSLLYLFVPQFALYGVTAVITAILAARRSFAAPMYAPILNNVLVIGVLVAFGVLIGHPTTAGVRHDTTALWLLGLGTTAGVAAMTVVLIPALRSVDARLRWVWNPGHPAVRTILRLSGWTAGFVVANQIALLVVIRIANHTTGDYTSYAYAYQFFLLPHAVWTVSLLGPMETEVAHSWQANDEEAARRHVIETIWTGMVLIVPAALGYAVLARPAINLVLLHGNMTSHGAHATADALIVFALGLPTFSLYIAFMRTYQALQDTRSMFFVYVLENALNIVLAVILYRHFGVRGLAAAWGLAYAAGALAAGVHLSRRMHGVGGRALRGAATSVLLAAVPATGAAWAVSEGLSMLPGGERQLGIAVRVVLAIVTAVSVYFLSARALGFDGIRRRLVL